MFDWGTCSALEAVPGKVSGAWLFKGTRVPVEALFANIGDMSVQEFCDQFPGVTQEQVELVLSCLVTYLRTTHAAA